MKFNQTNVKSLQIPGGLNSKGKPYSEFVAFDASLPMFGVRVRPGKHGKDPHRSFVALYKKDGAIKRYTIGNVAKVQLDDARKKARKIFGQVADGKDPVADKNTGAKESIGAMVAAYLAAVRPTRRESTIEGAEYYLETCWKPLHRLVPDAIDPQAIRKAVATRIAQIAADNGNVSANRARATLSAMFTWAIGEGMCGINPVAGTNKQKENDPRERALSDAEAAAVWLACPESDYGRIVRLLLLTGCRRDEIGSLLWSEIDTEARTITLPKERTKNKTQHIVPLSDLAMSVINEIPRRDRDLVFGDGKGGYSGWSRSKQSLDKKAALKQHWTLHDLRRTVRTGLGLLGIAPHIAEAVLNHLPAKLIRTYDRNTYAAEKKAALDAWANHLEAIISPSGPKGVSVRAVPFEGAEADGPRSSLAERLARTSSEMSQRPSIKGKDRRGLH